MPSLNRPILDSKMAVAAVFVLLSAAFIFGVFDTSVVVLADCQSGAWACSPAGAAAGTVNGGGMYRCVDGSYRQQTACSMASKCCVINDAPKCIALAATCGVPVPEPTPTPVTIPFPEPAPEPKPIPTVTIPFPLPAPAGPCSCDINSTDPKTCCKCDTGSFCSPSANSYRKCVNGCYRESACTVDKTLCGQITELCAAQSAKCKTPGQATCGIQVGQTFQPGYLQLCQKENSCLSSNYQCGLNAGQKQQLTDLFKNDNADLEVFDKAQYQTQDQDPNVVAKRKEFETQIIENIKTNPDFVRLLCLNFDYALSCGCDPELNPKYNDIKCTDIQSEVKPPVAEKTDCQPCNPGTVANGAAFGCGENLTLKDAKGVYAYKKCELNKDTTAGAPKGCWGQSLSCTKDNLDGCYQICLGARGIMTWDQNSLGGDKEAKAVTYFTGDCPKTFCMSSGAILSLNTISKAQFCDYKVSKDTKLSGCAKCHKDEKTKEAVCDQPGQTVAGKCGEGGQKCAVAGNQCFYPGNLQVCTKSGIGCDCANSASWDGVNSCARYPNEKCTADKTGYRELMPVSSYCFYAKSVSCPVGTICRQMAVSGVDGKYIACEAPVPMAPETAAVPASNLVSSASCDAGAFSCGNACFNPNNGQVCENGTILCKAGAYAASKDLPELVSKDYPEYICHPKQMAVLKLGPVMIADGHDSKCEYSVVFKVCEFDQICSNGQCVKNENAPSINPVAGKMVSGSDGKKIIQNFVGDLKSSYMVDRDNTSDRIEPTDCDLQFPPTRDNIKILADAQGCVDINKAVIEINSHNIKDVPYQVCYDELKNLVHGPCENCQCYYDSNGNYPAVAGSTFNCSEYSQQTKNLLRSDPVNIKGVYMGILRGTNGINPNIHAVVCIKAGVVRLFSGVIQPTFVCIEPQTGDIIGQVGEYDATPLTDNYNYYADGYDVFRVDDVVVVDNFTIKPSGTALSNDTAELYIYSQSGSAEITSDGFISTEKGGPIGVQIVQTPASSEAAQ